MFDLKLAITSAIVMFVLEYTVLLRVYRRSAELERISLVFAPAMIIISHYIHHLLQTYTDYFVKDRIDNIALFISFAILELPLALRGYEITPAASVLERVVVATTFGVGSTVIAQSILNK